MKRLAASLALCGSTFVAAPALAQVCPQERGGPVPGTMGAGLLSGTIERNAQIYSAAKMAERQLLPVLAGYGGAHVRYELGATPGAMRVPICSQDGGVEMGKVDLSGGGFGFGWRGGPISLYVVGTGATHTIAGPWNERVGSAFFGLALAPASPVAFAKQRFARGDGKLSVTFDAMVGAQFVSEYGTGSIAYSASNGVFGNLNLIPISAFGTAVYQAARDSLEAGATEQAEDLIDRIPYARFGFSTLDWITGAVEEIGTTSLYLRRLQYPSVPRGQVSFEDPDRTVSELGLTTYHFDQYGLFKHIDVSVAVASEPTTFLQEASVGIRSGNPLPTDVAMAKLARGEGSSNMSGMRVMVGVVQVPPIWYYGVEGGYRLRVMVEASLASDKGSDIFTIRMGMNSPETLSLYPYAHNSGDVYFGGAYQL